MEQERSLKEIAEAGVLTVSKDAVYQALIEGIKRTPELKCTPRLAGQRNEDANGQIPNQNPA